MITPVAESNFKPWQTFASISVVLALLIGFYIWSHVDAEDVQQSIVTNGARLQELGVVVQEITDTNVTDLVSAETVQRDPLGEFVFIEDPARKLVFNRQSVVVEPKSDGRMQILRGIRAGDHIVVSNAERLRLEPSIQPQAAATGGGGPPAGAKQKTN
ncbi:MAG: hypothetical protein ACYC67_00825 [Prosthecobacter sp.]